MEEIFWAAMLVIAAFTIPILLFLLLAGIAAVLTAIGWPIIAGLRRLGLKNER